MRERSKKAERNNILIEYVYVQGGQKEGDRGGKSVYKCLAFGNSGSVCVPVLFSQGHSDLSLLFWP